MIQKTEQYLQAQYLRKNGKSIRDIAQSLSISSSTASLWCRNVELSSEYKAQLASKSKNIELLRAFAKKRHETKLKNDEKMFQQAKLKIKKIDKNELFILGLTLYWAEGFKSKEERQVGFCNSDPRMIKFIMEWFKKSLKIPQGHFALRAEFNSSNTHRKDEIEKYWSDLTKIPLSQFHKPYLQKTNKVRDYSHRDRYYGILRIRIKKSSKLLVKIRGWIEGLSSQRF